MDLKFKVVLGTLIVITSITMFIYSVAMNDFNTCIKNGRSIETCKEVIR